MVWKIKTFDELTNRELYGILQLRAAVFIVEQGGRYQDMDGIDLDSLHIFGENDRGDIIACLRLFPKEDEPGTVQIGRVVTAVRGRGLGREMMARAEETAKERYGARSLYLTGRQSAYGFYLKCGYTPERAVSRDGVVLYHEWRRPL